MSCKTSEMIEGKLHYHVVCKECHCVFTIRSIHYIGIYKDWCSDCTPEQYLNI